MIKNCCLGVVACLFFFCLQIQAQSKPNVILFLVDDMGWQDCSVPFWDTKTRFNSIYETPHMERLAKQGVKFTNAYANSVCTPTRISLLTGMNVVRHGVTNWTNVKKDTPTDHPDDKLIPPIWNYNGLSPIPNLSQSVYATTLPSLLQKEGYHTIQCGKAHFAPYGTPGADPLQLGFDVNIAGTAAGHPGSFLAEDRYKGNVSDTLWAVRHLDHHIEQGDFLTDALTQEAIAALNKNKNSGKPFFLYMSHYAVHLPFSKDKRFYQKYIDKGLTDIEARYAGLIEGMDKSLGQLMDYLKEIGADQNTYIIFMSDNGGLSLSPQRSGLSHTQNLPLKMGKGSLYEGGIRVPFLVAGPGIKGQTVSHQPIVVEDLFATILEWAGVKKIYTEQKIDGVSINRFLYNTSLKDEKKILLWHYPNNWTNVNQHGVSWASAIRQGRWKLIYFHKDNSLELYDIVEDISESRDLSRVFPAQLKYMANLMTNELKRRNAQMPTSQSTGVQIPWPNAIIDIKN